MTTIEIKGINSESKAVELLQALEILKSAGVILKKHTPQDSERCENESFRESMIEASARHSELICEVSEAIGRLVSYDVSGFYLL